MQPYGIGLDIGVASVGWAVVALDGEDQPRGIIDMGARIFDAAEHPKTGASLALPRREARSARRRLRRHRHRNERIRTLLVSSGLLSKSELSGLFSGQLEDIYALRVRALDDAVDAKSFARILLHLSQRRGFKSNRRNPSDAEEGKLLEAVSENNRRMEENGYRTVGEMLLRDPAFSDVKRNKGGEYRTTVTRDMVEAEARALFDAQRKKGALYATEELEEGYLEILLGQRSFDEGPGGDSPYGGNQIEKMVGKCTLIPEEPRAAKATYSFEYFNLLEKINHIRLISNGKSVPLTDTQRRALIDLAHRVENLHYARIRRELSLSPEQRFNMVRYPFDKTPEEAEKATKFIFLKAYHRMRSAFEKASKGSFVLLSREQRNAIGTALTLYKTPERIRSQLAGAGIAPELFDLIESIGSFSKFGHLSVKACEAVIPYLEQGMNYNDACTAAGLDFKAHGGGEKSLLLSVTEETFEGVTSPVVKRSISQTVKVLNAIIRKQGGSPTYLNIELARELSRNFSERKKAERDMAANQERNQQLMELLRDEYRVTNATGQDLVKLKLFREQDGVCAYSLRRMSLEQLFSPGYAEVDHIVPYSLSFDDSYKNKVLVLAEENRNKGNRLPLQYLTGKRREDFIVWTKGNVRDDRKRQLLLKESLTEEDEKRFKERSLQDTKTMSVYLLNLVQDELAFAPFSRDRKKHVTAVNGAVTAYLRRRWGITKIREDGDLHHAVDAVVVACATDGLIQRVSRYAAGRESRYMVPEEGTYVVDRETGEALERFPFPWPQFRKELEARLCHDPARVLSGLRIPFYWDDEAPEVKPLFVSRMPRRKVTGAAHKDTVKSARELEHGIVIVKRPLEALKLKNGEIENYYDPASDRLLYEALKARLAAFGGDGKKAFTEPFYKPKSDGTPGPLVKKVKLTEPVTLSVPVQGGTAVADNDSMVRIDVFRVEDDGYYFVPIYVADALRPELPDRAVVAHKPRAEWKVMRPEDFVFSLYPNDLIRVTHRQGITLSKIHKESTLPDTRDVKSELLYFKGADIAGGAISCINHDNTYKIGGLGIKRLESMEKYTVDMLGEIHPVRRERRVPITGKRGG